jgi:hypothetical protein
MNPEPQGDLPVEAAESAATEQTWDQRILARIDSGIDVTQIEANLRLTPTERLERMEAVLRELEEMRVQSGLARRLTCSPSRPRGAK